MKYGTYLVVEKLETPARGKAAMKKAIIQPTAIIFTVVDIRQRLLNNQHMTGLLKWTELNNKGFRCFQYGLRGMLIRGIRDSDF